MSVPATVAARNLLDAGAPISKSEDRISYSERSTAATTVRVMHDFDVAPARVGKCDGIISTVPSSTSGG